MGEGRVRKVFTSVGEMQRYMEELDDAQQRRYLRQVSIETHVALHKHIIEEGEYKEKLNQIHEALFHPQNGLVNLRDWMCRIAKTASAVFGAFLAMVAAAASAGHSFGWW